MMKMKSKVIVSLIAVIVMAFGIAGIAMADDTSSIASKGRIVFDNGTSDTTDDVIFDSADLTTIENEVKNGKTSVAAAINSYSNTDIGSFPTFSDIVDGVNNLTTIPANTYYYDKTTGTDDASTIKRYKKVGTEYFECDGSGNLVDENADSVTSENLVAYTGINNGNLSAGSAGYADKSLVLGDGSDNISYMNKFCYVGMVNDNGRLDYLYVNNDNCYEESNRIIMSKSGTLTVFISSHFNFNSASQGNYGYTYVYKNGTQIGEIMGISRKNNSILINVSVVPGDYITFTNPNEDVTGYYYAYFN